MAGRRSRTSSADADTIVAVATPPGAGLRAVVRLSGPDALAIASGLPGAVLLRGPRTSTREDVAEIHLPSSPPLVRRLLDSVLRRGARPARPGEFTLRAFLSGRIDLAQAEAVEQLISAEGEEERRAAVDQLQGAFSSRVRAIEDQVLDLGADAEAAIDFADQDIEVLPVEEARRRAEQARAALELLLAECASRRILEVRPVVALCGRPNAGKSSLFNALTGGRAIVTDVPGTTRDVLASDVEMGVPVRLLDTAGIQEAHGPDGDAVRRARAAVETADLVLLVVDATESGAREDLLPRGRPGILVRSKCDLAPAAGPSGVDTSARTGQGLDELRRTVGRLLSEGSPGARFRLDLRQKALLHEAREALARSVGGALGLGMEFVALDLRAALDSLGGVTGRNVEEGLLDRIFSRFCLGK